MYGYDSAALYRSAMAEIEAYDKLPLALKQVCQHTAFVPSEMLKRLMSGYSEKALVAHYRQMLREMGTEVQNGS